MALYSFIGVAVTSATIVIFGETIWDPIELLKRFDNRYTLTFAMLSLALATLATNIAANVVGPANDFAHLNPKVISFRMGGLITGILGILIQPWRLLDSANVYVFTFLNGYSLLLGACGGVLIADYWILRHGELELEGLYENDGPYRYSNGWNWRAIVALIAGMSISIPGFIAQLGELPALASTLGTIGFPAWLTQIYDYAWFASFGVAFVVYLILMSRFAARRED